MTTHTRLRLGAIAFVLLILFLLSGAHLCGAAIKDANNLGSRPIESSIVGCTEFWLNRYQTLIGALIALAAALIAVGPARAQLKEMARQSAASAREPLRELAEALEKEHVLLVDLGALIVQIRRQLTRYDEETAGVLHETWYNIWIDLEQASQEFMDRYYYVAKRYVDKDGQYAVRKMLEINLALCVADMKLLRDVFRKNTSGPWYEEGEVDVTPDETSDARHSMGMSLDRLAESRNEAQALVRAKISESWQDVRRLEELAVKG